jgi:hypothetical protein
VNYVSVNKEVQISLYHDDVNYAYIHRNAKAVSYYFYFVLKKLERNSAPLFAV